LCYSEYKPIVFEKTTLIRYFIYVSAGAPKFSAHEPPNC